MTSGLLRSIHAEWKRTRKWKRCMFLLSHSLSLVVNGPLGPVCTEHSVNAATTLAILLSLKTMESLQNGLQPYSGATFAFTQSSITTIFALFMLMMSVNGPLGPIHSERTRKRNVIWIFMTTKYGQHIWIDKILTRGQCCLCIHFNSM